MTKTMKHADVLGLDGSPDLCRRRRNDRGWERPSELEVGELGVSTEGRSKGCWRFVEGDSSDSVNLNLERRHKEEKALTALLS